MCSGRRGQKDWMGVVLEGWPSEEKEGRTFRAERMVAGKPQAKGVEGREGETGDRQRGSRTRGRRCNTPLTQLPALGRRIHCTPVTLTGLCVGITGESSEAPATRASPDQSNHDLWGCGRGICLC